MALPPGALPGLVPKPQPETLAAAFRTVFAYASRSEIEAWYGHVTHLLARLLAQVAALMVGAKEETRLL